MRKIKEKFKKTLFLGDLPTGCELCHKGSKIVLFVAGTCELPPFCKWYCPISFERRGKTVSYVNEERITSDDQIIKEANMIEAEGAAITGGEPLHHFKKTIEYIKLLKDHFGSNFHIHLYSNGISLSKSRIIELKVVGLDEIRLHPIPSQWEKVEWCLSSGIQTGVEIPAIPFQFPKLKSLIRYLDKIGAFLNLNELEMTESNAKTLKMFGYSLKRDTMAAVTGSEKFALKILEWARPLNLNVHYCPIGYKDGIQLKMRYLRRARNIARPHEQITDEGLLFMGIAFRPETGINELHDLRNSILNEISTDPSSLIVNPDKLRLEFSLDLLDEIIIPLKKRNYSCGVIEELPLDGQNRIQMTFTPL